MKKPTKLEVANQTLREENAKLRAIFDEMQKPKDCIGSNQCTSFPPKPHHIVELAKALIQNRQKTESLTEYRTAIMSDLKRLSDELKRTDSELVAATAENSNLQHELERAAR